MRNLMYYFFVSLLLLGGCSNSGDNSRKQDLREESQQVRISLGSNENSTVARYKGSYSDIENVSLFYMTPDGTEEQSVPMLPVAGGGWEVVLELTEFGSYTFRAEASDDQSEMIFTSGTAVERVVTADMTSLDLGLQMNPIELSTSGIMPRIVSVSKPANYQAGAGFIVEFSVQADSTDTLTVSLAVKNSENSSLGIDPSPKTLTGSDSYPENNFTVDIPQGTSGSLNLELRVYSQNLGAAAIAEFSLEQSAQLGTSQSLVFMPVVTDYALSSNEDTLSTEIEYKFNVDGDLINFTCDLTFLYDDSSGEKTHSFSPSASSTCAAEVSGTLTRSMSESGLIRLIFKKTNGEQELTNHFDVVVPAGPSTSFITNYSSIPFPPGYLPAENKFEGVVLAEASPGHLVNGTLTDSSAVEFYLIEVAEGSFWRFEPVNNSLSISITILDSAGEPVDFFEVGSQGDGGYLPVGAYEMQVSSVTGAGGDYGFYVYYEPTHVVQNAPTAQFPAEFFGAEWVSSTAKQIYNVYFNADAGRLNFIESLESAGNGTLNFCLRDPNSGQNWDCADTTTSNSGMFLDNTDANGPSSGWYNLEISSPGISSYPYYADWAAYETLAEFSTASTHSIKTPDEFTYILQSESDSFWLAMHSVTVDQVYEIQTDCTQDVWIYTNNIVKAYNSTSNPVGSSSNGSFTIPYGECTSSMTLSLTPDGDGSIHFAILLLNPPPPPNVSITTIDYQIMEGSSGTISVSLDRSLSPGETYVVDLSTGPYSDYVSFSPSSSIEFNEDNGPFSVQVTIYDDDTTGVLNANIEFAEITILAEISGTMKDDYLFFTIIENTSP